MKRLGGKKDTIKGKIEDVLSGGKRQYTHCIDMQLCIPVWLGGERQIDSGVWRGGGGSLTYAYIYAYMPICLHAYMPICL